MSSTTVAPDDALAVPGFHGVREADELANYAAVAAALQARSLRRERREFLKTAALCVAIALIPSGWVARELMPEVRQEIEFVPLMPDGTVASAHRWENLPAEVRGDMVVNTLWNYVRLREGYSYTGAEYAWRIVSALSGDAVRTEYQLANDPQNPGSPFRTFGDKVRVDVSFDSHIDLCTMEGCRPGEPPVGYQFRFLRTEVREGRPGTPAFYVAQVRFNRGVAQIDPRQRYTFNAPGVQVVEYVPGTQAGVQSGARR